MISSISKTDNATLTNEIQKNVCHDKSDCKIDHVIFAQAAVSLSILKFVAFAILQIEDEA